MNNVKFVSYNGKYPNLCSGILVLNVCETDYVFPVRSLETTGSMIYDKENAQYEFSDGPWEIINWPEKFPKEFMKEAIDVVNENVKYGHCGGCV